MRDRFKKEVDKSVEKYTASVSVDKRLYKQDIAGYVENSQRQVTGTVRVKLLKGKATEEGLA